MKRSVAVTGLGTVSPFGTGVERFWKGLVGGKCGIRSINDRLESPTFDNLPSRIAATVPSTSELPQGGWNISEWFPQGNSRNLALFSQYAVAAATQAVQDAQLEQLSTQDKENVGVCVGSGIGSIHDFYETSNTLHQLGLKKVSPMFVPKILINLAAGHISMKYGFQGPNHSVSTACTTGAHAIGDASRFIEYGDADVMIAGGSEACIHPLAVAGFSRAKSLAVDWNDSPTESSRPFDRNRAGFVLGEGAGVVVLEELEHAKRRGANIYCQLKGYGVSADAHHITAPPSDGKGAFLAMQRALRHSGVAPSGIDYINAHATSTKIGDVAENNAIKKLMLGPEGVQKASDINVSSIKGAIGHLLGAAGAVEAIASILAISNVQFDLSTILLIRQDVLPPTLNCHAEPNEGFDCNYVPLQAQDKRIRACLTNSFGFGGTNASICFAKS